MEAAGLTTITLSPIPRFTASVGVPRIAAIEFPPGRLFGEPGDAAVQTAILQATLAAAHAAERPGTVVELPFTWPERAAADWHPRESPPIARMLKRRPWLFAKLLAGEIPD